MAFSTLTRRLVALTATATLALGALPSAGASAMTPHEDALDPNSDAAAASIVDRTSVLLQLTGTPLATAPGVERTAGRINLNGPKARAARAAIAQQHAAVRAWLKTEAPQATITAEFDLSINALAIRLGSTPIEKLRRAPHAASVSYQATYTPKSVAWDDPDLGLIKAVTGWQAAGDLTESTGTPTPQRWSGYGTKIGIIDTGIDRKHPCFDDTGYPQTPQRGDLSDTNNKVIVARTFSRLEASASVLASPTGLNPHGTHVASTAACNLTRTASIDGAEIPYDPSGVAPGAQLGSYNLFPEGASQARTEDVIAALEAAYTDGMDIANLAVGTRGRGVQDATNVAIDNLDRAGLLVVTAAGNDGNANYTVSSPASAERALTVGASSVGQFVGVPITIDGALVGVGSNGDFPLPETPRTAPVAALFDREHLGDGCATPTTDVSGKIVVMARGGCTFSRKVAIAEQAGAVAAIVVNNVPGDPTSMSMDAAHPSTIPAVQVGQWLSGDMMALDGSTVTLGSEPSYTYSGVKNVLESYSARGPVASDRRLKPDVIAPGGNVIGALPEASCMVDDIFKPSFDPSVGCWGSMSGTSMASAHVAGMAAVLKGEHPDWTPAQLRSAIIDTARRDSIQSLDADGNTTLIEDAQRVGAGLVDLNAAINARLASDQPTVSFYATDAAETLHQKITVTALGKAATVPVTVRFAKGPGTFTVSSREITVTPQRPVTIDVSYQSKAKAGFAQAQLYLGDGTHVPLFAVNE